MSITDKKFECKAEDSWVEVRGETGAIKATWSLVIDGATVATEKTAGGVVSLVGTLPSGKQVEAKVDQGGFGGVTVEVYLNGDLIDKGDGFLA